MLLYQITHKNYLNESCTFFGSHFHTNFQVSILSDVNDSEVVKTVMMVTL